MLTDYFLKRKIAELVRRSRDDTRMDRYTSIAELGRLPPTYESVTCLIQHTRDRHSGEDVEAIRALGLLNDRRATDHLVRMLQNADWLDTAIMEALAQPHHASALHALAEMARARCQNDDSWDASRLVDLMRSMDPLASQPHIEALAPLLLKSGLRELRVAKHNYTYGQPNCAERILALCQQSTGRAALQTLRDALVQRHRQTIMNAGELGEIQDSLAWLKQSSHPAAADAVSEFLRTPSREVTTYDQREVSDSPNLAYETYKRSGYTSEVGQPVGPEELAARVASAEARQSYEDAETKRRHRENIYPSILTHGDQRDLEDYAHACLTNPRYDIYFSDWRRDPGAPKLNNLARYVQRAHDNINAAELLRLIMVGDRTRLWASAHEAIAKEIDWKPLAVELLERTGDQEVDKLLISRIEAEWAAGKASPLLEILAQRNPAQMVEVAARHLLHRSTIGPNEARQIVLANAPTALRVARELYARTDWFDHTEAFCFLISVPGPEAEAELSAWVAAETNQHCLDSVARQKGAEFVKQCKATAARPPVAESAPIRSTQSASTSQAPDDHAALWARLLACLEKRRAMPTGPATPGDIARHADAVLGHREVSRFVFEYYYPAINGETATREAAEAWVEQFEKSA